MVQCLRALYAVRGNQVRFYPQYINRRRKCQEIPFSCFFEGGGKADPIEVGGRKLLYTTKGKIKKLETLKCAL